MRIALSIALLCFTLIVGKNTFAQSEDFGIWLDAESYKQIGPYRLAVCSEFYTNNNNQSIDRFSIGADGSRKLTPFLNLGMGYLMMNKNKTDRYEIRHRFYTTATANGKISNFKFSLRERLQITSYPRHEAESQKSLWYWRNRAKISYQIPSCKITPLIGVETFLLLNQKTPSKRLDEVRYNLSAAYPLTPSSQIELYGLLAKMPNLSQYILGVIYLIEI
jgi:hypothetical protein